MKRNKIYVGVVKHEKREVFKSKEIPTPNSFPRYVAVIGPFRTLRAANLLASFEGQNPHCQCVADAERLVKRKLTK